MKPMTVVILALLSVPALAATEPAKPKLSPEAEKKHAEYFKRGDANSDGFISKEEYTAKALKRFDEADTNHDGKLSPQEMTTYREAKKTERAKRKAARKAAKAQAATPVPAAK